MSESKRKNGTFIHGIGASEHLDSSGERISIEGVDISSLTTDGVLNLEHQSKEASSIVGKIWEAKKILKRSDCESDHHKYFWDKIKMPFIYIAGELFDAVGHKEASEVAAMVRYDQQEPINKDAKKLINFSIEGSRVEKQGAIITKCIARKISITLTPCNKVCEAEELKLDPKEEKHSDSGKFAFIQDIMSKADEPSCQIMKGEIPFIYKAAPDLKPSLQIPKSPAATAAPAASKAPKKSVTNIARPDAGFGAIHDKTKPPKPGHGKVIFKGKKTPVKMTAEEAVDEHKKLVGVLESPSHKDDKKEAKKQRKELKEYKEKLDKGEKKPNPKDPVLNQKIAPKPPTAEYTEKVKGYLANKKKLNKYDSNVRKALTASCGLGASPAAKVQGDAVAKSLPKKSLPLPKFFNDHKDVIPKDHPDHSKAVEHIAQEHRTGNKLEARRLHDRYISGGGNFIVRKSENDLAKASWNVRQQRKKVFGSKSQPSAGSAMRDKHLAHIKQFVDKFLGLDLNPSGGKINEATGQRRDEAPEEGMDKPDWRSGRLESQWNPEAAIHEIAHLMLLPKGIGLEDGQRYMDKQYADVQRKYGYMKQKRSQGEVQPMAAEQLIRRFLGLPASQVSVPVKSKDEPPRTSVEDPSQTIATRVKQGTDKLGNDKYVDLIRQARNLHPEHRKRLEDVFTKKIIFDPDRGWIPNKTSLDTAITNRQPGAVIARQQKERELPPNVVRMKKPAPAPMQAPQDTQDQVNPPEMAQPKMKIAKSEIRKAMKMLGDQAFERFEKKEELLKFLSQKLPNISDKERLAIAKAVAYTNQKKKEAALQSLMEKDDEQKV